MVADAVAVEPVSGRQFPANREIYREFECFGALAGSSCCNHAIPMVCSKIPYGVEQRIFLSRTRKLELPNRECRGRLARLGEFYLVFGVELWRGLRFTEFELVRSLPFARR